MPMHLLNNASYVFFVQVNRENAKKDEVEKIANKRKKKMKRKFTTLS